MPRIVKHVDSDFAEAISDTGNNYESLPAFTNILIKSGMSRGRSQFFPQFLYFP